MKLSTTVTRGFSRNRCLHFADPPSRVALIRRGHDLRNLLIAKRGLADTLKVRLRALPLYGILQPCQILICYPQIRLSQKQLPNYGFNRSAVDLMLRGPVSIFAPELLLLGRREAKRCESIWLVNASHPLRCKHSAIYETDSVVKKNESLPN